MISEFKTKEQLRKEKIYEMANDFKGKKKERFIRIGLEEPQDGDRLFFSNLLIDMKFSLREIFKKQKECFDQLESTRISLELGGSKKELQSLKKYENTLVEYKDILKKQILNYGSTLVNIIIPEINNHFTEDEIIQLVGGPEDEAKKIKEVMTEIDLKNSEKGFAFNLIFHRGEYRLRKGRSKDFIDCPKWEMPLFWAVSDYIYKEINSNPELKHEMDNLFQEMFEDAIVYPKHDNQGNVVGFDKAIQEIGIKELMTNYKDLEPNGIITRLKRQRILDINTTFKLKREQGDLTIKYKVMDLDGNDLGCVFKA